VNIRILTSDLTRTNAVALITLNTEHNNLAIYLHSLYLTYFTWQCVRIQNYHIHHLHTMSSNVKKNQIQLEVQSTTQTQELNKIRPKMLGYKQKCYHRSVSEIIQRQKSAEL
jgi:hypothetical protein